MTRQVSNATFLLWSLGQKSPQRTAEAKQLREWGKVIEAMSLKAAQKAMGKLRAKSLVIRTRAGQWEITEAGLAELERLGFPIRVANVEEIKRKLRGDSDED